MEEQQQLLEHFMHKHPLRLVSVEKEAVRKWQEAVCYACQKPISAGSAYTCTEKCILFLHKRCAELPEQIDKYPMHSIHPLVLSPTPHKSSSCTCNVCKIRDWRWFTYSCRSGCSFDVHVSCAMDESAITHEIHNHPLTFVQRPASFSCDACGNEERDFSYRCNTCQFWIHKACASLPITILHHTHNMHPLVLAYSVPAEYHQFIRYCNICRERVFLNYGIYSCYICCYFIHLKCATSKEDPFMLRGEESEVEDDDDDKDVYPDLMHFPVKDGSVDLLSQFVKVITSSDDDKQESSMLNHFSLEHPLTLSDTDHADNGVVCNGCLQPISTPFYSCGKCSFFLHIHCIKLPAEWQHPCHPEHLLELHNYSLWSSSNNFNCNACGMSRKGLAYRCEACDLYLDVECACLRNTIKHKSHRHPLKIQRREANHKCNACANIIPDIKMGCQTCGFYLHYQCATLPATVNHVWDQHPLYLIYSPSLIDDPEDVFCEICEEDIQPKLWLYHCRICRQSFHPQCVLAMASYKNVESNVEFADTFHTVDHPHPLTIVQKNTNESSCDQCGEDREDVPIFVCETCNFQLCMACVSRIP